MRYVHIISASDSSGGAGMQQDVKTANLLGCWPICTLTGVTAQSFDGVSAVESVSSDLLRAQLESSAHFQVAAVKIGAVFDLAALKQIDAYLRNIDVPIIYDPVFVPTGGEPFYQREMISYFAEKMLEHITLLTPNKHELEKIVGRECREIRELADYLSAKYRAKPSFFISGGHFEGSVIKEAFAGSTAILNKKEKLTLRYNHGTGCMLSTAIACLTKNSVTADTCFRASQIVSERYHAINKEMGYIF